VIAGLDTLLIALHVELIDRIPLAGHAAVIPAARRW
jgi:hypothetical protein